MFPESKRKCTQTYKELFSPRAEDLRELTDIFQKIQKIQTSHNLNP